MKRCIRFLVVCVAVLCGVTTVSAADQAADKATIEKTVKSYTAAFNDYVREPTNDIPRSMTRPTEGRCRLYWNFIPGGRPCGGPRRGARNLPGS